MFVRDYLLLITLILAKNVCANKPFQENPKYKKAKKSKRIPGEYIVLFSDKVLDDEGDNNKSGRYLRNTAKPNQKRNNKGKDTSAGNKQQKDKIQKKFEDIIGIRASNEGSTAEVQIDNVYNKAIKGVHVKNLSPGAIRRLLKSDDVQIVEENQKVELDQLTGSQDVDATGNNIWGLDRIDQESSSMDGVYQYGTLTGAGVDIYVIDTGIRASHNDFGGRASCPVSFIDYEECEDLQSHGTHCAGTAGGTTHGVAKMANLIGVKVMDRHGSGSITSIVGGIEWAINQVESGAQSKPSVITMSLGYSSISTATAAAIQSAIDAGISYAAAAGNSNTDACTHLSYPNAVVVAATDIHDSRAYYSNYGSCTDIFAPGSDVWSAGIEDDDSVSMKSGTSMATPHVAGVMALILQLHPQATPTQVKQALMGFATRGAVSDANGTPNYLLHLPQSGPLPPTELTPGQRETISASSKVEKHFYITVRAEAKATCYTSGQNGDADLYVKFGVPPTTDDFYFDSLGPGSNEETDFTTPSSNGQTLYVMVLAYSSFTDVELWCDLEGDTPSPTPPPTTPTPTSPPTLPPPPKELTSGQIETLSSSSKVEKHFYITVPAESTGTCYTSGNNGDADLYYKFGSSPTTTDNDFASTSADSNEVAGPIIPAIAGRTLYVMVYAFSSFTNVELWCDLEGVTPSPTPPPTTPTPTSPPTLPPPPKELTPGQSETISLSSGDKHFYITVPAASTATCHTSGSNGDTDLYLRIGASPTSSEYDFASASFDSNEEAGPTTPETVEQTLYVRVYAFSSFTNVELWCDVEGVTPSPTTPTPTPPPTPTPTTPTPTSPPTLPPPPTELTSGQIETLSMLSSTGERHFFIAVPADSTATCYTSGNNGDADLYMKLGASPTTYDYDFGSTSGGSEEEAGPTTPATVEQTLYVMVEAFSSFTNVELWCDVESVNHAPYFLGIKTPTSKVGAGQQKVFLLEAEDPDNDSLTMSLVSGGSGGFQLTSTGNGKGELMFPGQNHPGTYSAVIKVSDGRAEDSITAKVTVEESTCSAKRQSCRSKACCDGLVCHRRKKKCVKQKKCQKKGARCSRSKKCCNGLRCRGRGNRKTCRGR